MNFWTNWKFQRFFTFSGIYSKTFFGSQHYLKYGFYIILNFSNTSKFIFCDRLDFEFTTRIMLIYYREYLLKKIKKNKFYLYLRNAIDNLAPWALFLFFSFMHFEFISFLKRKRFLIILSFNSKINKMLELFYILFKWRSICLNTPE